MDRQEGLSDGTGREEEVRKWLRKGEVEICLTVIIRNGL